MSNSVRTVSEVYQTYSFRGQLRFQYLIKTSQRPYGRQPSEDNVGRCLKPGTGFGEDVFRGEVRKRIAECDDSEDEEHIQSAADLGRRLADIAAVVAGSESAPVVGSFPKHKDEDRPLESLDAGYVSAILSL